VPVDSAFPVGQGWDQIRFPRVDDENAYALEVTGDSMQPLLPGRGYASSSRPIRRRAKGDRVVLRTTDGEVMAKVLVRPTAKTIELTSFPSELDFPRRSHRLDCAHRLGEPVVGSRDRPPEM
jgi:phage repressor protein C with HTH and peptisase S24 domain